tara:strand:- start:60861 stop:61058 length:198 start_codon:yes stop_codon:yes gene_type:complete
LQKKRTGKGLALAERRPDLEESVFPASRFLELEDVGEPALVAKSSDFVRDVVKKFEEYKYILRNF